MASKTRWRYKNTALVLKPWILHLLIDGDLKQKAQKVQVINIKSLSTGPHPDGHLAKVISDGQMYIKAFFTPKAVEDLNKDREAPPVLDGKMLILIDYIIEFLPNNLLENCEFSIVVSKFTIMADLAGYDSKHYHVHCMSLVDVKKKCSILWDQWRNNRMDMSLCSLPLTQLLEELGRQSFETEEENDNIQVDGKEITSPITMNGQESDQQSKLSSVDVSEFCISKADIECLEAITEWTSSYKPPNSQSSSEHPSSVFGSKSMLRGQKLQDNLEKVSGRAYSNRSWKDHVKSKEDEKDTTTTDAEIQVSPSLWMDFIHHHITQDRKGETVEGNQLESAGISRNKTPKTLSTKKQEGKPVPIGRLDIDSVSIDGNDSPNTDSVPIEPDRSDSVLEVLSPDSLGKSSPLRIEEEFSPSLLLSCEDMRLMKDNHIKDLIVIEDSFVEDRSMEDSSESEKQRENNFIKTDENSSKKVVKNPNYNDSPSLINGVSVSMEKGNCKKDFGNQRSDLLIGLKQKNLFHSKGVVATEELDEENRLFELKNCTISFSYGSSNILNINSNKTKTTRLSCSNGTKVSESNNIDFRNIVKMTKTSCEKCSRSAEDVKGHGTSKRKPAMSGSEICSKKQTIENSKKPALKKYFFRSRPCLEKVSHEKSQSVENNPNLDHIQFGNPNEKFLQLLNNSSDKVTVSSRNTETKLIKISVKKSTPDSFNENIREIPDNSSDSNTTMIYENVKINKTACSFSTAEHLETPIAKEDKFPNASQLVVQSPDIVISPPSPPSRKGEDHSGSFLNDAQVISSGETFSGHAEQKQVESITPEGTPINSLPSYQPPREVHTVCLPHEGVSLKSLRETFWGLFEPEPLSDVGRVLMNLTFSKDVVMKIEASFSRTSVAPESDKDLKNSVTELTLRQSRT